MKPDRTYPDEVTVRAALDIACRAPSVHNTQPWRWAVADRSVHLFADRSRQLPVIDHHGRELTMSCGAALHHARTAFRALGWRAEVHLLPNPADPDHLAAVELSPLTRIDRHVLALVAASAQRRTDRRPFLPDAVPPHLLDQLLGAARAEQVDVTVLTDPVRRRETVVALAHADAVQRANPMYQAEIAEWSRTHIGSVQGVLALNIPATSTFGRGMPGRDFGTGELAGPPPIDDGAVLCVLSTATDTAVDWLRTGEALSAILLSATRAGLASCTLSQVTEQPVTRAAIRQAVLDGVGEPHLVVRLGWPVTATFPGTATPRRTIEDVLDERYQH
jgi:nitroreductase